METKQNKKKKRKKKFFFHCSSSFFILLHSSFMHQSLFFGSISQKGFSPILGITKKQDQDQDHFNVCGY